MKISFRRFGIIILAGLFFGLAVLALLLGADYLAKIPQRQEAMHSQENLVSAFCVDEGFDRLAVLTVYPETEEDGEGSFSYDSIRWYRLESEGTRLMLPPGDYTVITANSTRLREEAVTLTADEETVLRLTTKDAPQCPEFLRLEGSESKDEVFPLSFAKDCEAILLGAPDGVSLEKTGDEWSIFVGGGLEGGYYPFRLQLTNTGGSADVYMALNIPLSGEEIGIKTAAELLAMRENPKGRYYLENDLDLSDIGSWTLLFSPEEPFGGSFDGRGYEISGLTMTVSQETPHNSLFGYLKGAQVRNLIIREPIAQGRTVEKTLTSAAAMANNSESSLIENCAVLGGTIAVGGPCAGMIGGSGNSHLIGLFNSADAFSSVDAILPNTGGISGMNSSDYIAYCANEGDMQGNHLTGGISGFATGSAYRYCLNSGQIRGINLAATYLPGGIIQSAGGGSKSHCLFLRGQSPYGAGGGGAVFSIEGITWQQLRDACSLSALGSFEGDSPRWGFSSSEAQSAVPWGIFSKTCDAPEAVINDGGEIFIPERAGTDYYYTLDGSDPRLYGIKAGSLSITLGKNQTLAVFASEKRCYDSETVYYRR